MRIPPTQWYYIWTIWCSMEKKKTQSERKRQTDQFVTVKVQWIRTIALPFVKKPTNNRPISFDRALVKMKNKNLYRCWLSVFGCTVPMTCDRIEKKNNSYDSISSNKLWVMRLTREILCLDHIENGYLTPSVDFTLTTFVSHLARCVSSLYYVKPYDIRSRVEWKISFFFFNIWFATGG